MNKESRANRNRYDARRHRFLKLYNDIKADFDKYLDRKNVEICYKGIEAYGLIIFILIFSPIRRKRMDLES